MQTRKRLTEVVEAEGHLIDSQLLNEIFDTVIKWDAKFDVQKFRIGRTNEEPSFISMRITGPDEAALNHVLEGLVSLGCRIASPHDAALVRADKDGCVPNDFYSTTNHRTFVRYKGEWLEVEQQRMDAVIVVDDGRAVRDWATLDASAVLPSPFGRDDLLDVLTAHAPLIGLGGESTLDDVPHAPTSGWRAPVVAVTGPGGTGASTLAMAIAQGLGDSARHGGLVVLADLALDADQAMLHDAGDVVPGVQELVEAHRAGDSSAHDIRALTFAVPQRHYQLLLGLRRHRDWATIRPRAFAAAFDNLRRAYKVVVADCSPDLEGEDECGSIDVEERNTMARTAVGMADVLVIVGLPGPKGLHRMVRLVHAATSLGVEPGCVLPVLNRAPRSPRARSELTRAFAELSAPLTVGRSPFAPLLPLGERRHLDDVSRDVVRLPASLMQPITDAVGVLLDRARAEPVARAPTRVRPGSLGRADDD